MSAAMRALFVNPGRALGGAEHSLLLLLQGVRARTIEADVATFGQGPFRDRLSALGLPTVDVALPRWARAAGRYRLPDGSETEWGEQVTDEEYTATPQNEQPMKEVRS